jgi:hypothetical protein
VLIAALALAPTTLARRLRTQVIPDQTIMKWDGKKKDFPVWDSSVGRERELENLRSATRMHGLFVAFSAVFSSNVLRAC